MDNHLCSILRKIAIIIVSIFSCLIGGYLLLNPIEGGLFQTQVSADFHSIEAKITIPFILIILGILMFDGCFNSST